MLYIGKYQQIFFLHKQVNHCFYRRSERYFQKLGYMCAGGDRLNPPRSDAIVKSLCLPEISVLCITIKSLYCLL